MVAQLERAQRSGRWSQDAFSARPSSRRSGGRWRIDRRPEPLGSARSARRERALVAIDSGVVARRAGARSVEAMRLVRWRPRRSADDTCRSAGASETSLAVEPSSALGGGLLRPASAQLSARTAAAERERRARAATAGSMPPGHARWTRPAPRLARPTAPQGRRLANDPADRRRPRSIGTSLTDRRSGRSSRQRELAGRAGEPQRDSGRDSREPPGRLGRLLLL